MPETTTTEENPRTSWRVTVAAVALRAALDQAATVLDPKSMLLPLRLARLTCNGRVRLEAVGHACHAEAWLPATQNGEADVLVDVPALQAMLTAKSTGYVEIECDGGPRACVSYRDVQTTVECQPVDAWPSQLPRASGLSSVPASDLLALLEGTVHSAHPDSHSYPHMACICLETDEGHPRQYRAVATDGHRLSVVTRSFYGPPLPGGRVLIPAQAVRPLLRMLRPLAKKGEGVGLGVDEQVLEVYAQDHSLRVRLVDGKFPPYLQCVPTSCDVEAHVSRKRLAQTLTRICKRARADKRHPHVMVTVGGESVEVKLQLEVGEDQESLPAATHGDRDGDRAEFGINARYLLDWLESVDDLEVSIECTRGGIDPVLLRSDGQRCYSVIMPVRP